MELMAVLVIMAVCLSLGIDTIAHFDAEFRAERSARNCAVFLRYARNLAMTTGYPAKLSINTSMGCFAVYSATNTGGTAWHPSPVSQSLICDGSMSITLAARRDLFGTTMTVSPDTITEFAYNQLGTCNTSGTLIFSCAGVAKQVAVPTVGDPVLN